MALTRINVNFIEDQIRAGALLPWANDIGYQAVPSFAVGSDGLVYRSTAANGVDTDGSNIGPGPIDPVTDTTGVWEEFATTGATGGGRNRVFYENDQLITEDYTITTNRNAMSAGPITVGTEINVTAITSNGTVLTISTSDPHNMSVGDDFTLSGTTNYNGSYTVATVVDSDTITALSAINAASESTGTLTETVTVTVPNGSTWAVV